jgi:phenylpropionate dioxygenase-like ring-hydroxylating dioxygenase large terminal subunit
MLRDAEGAIRVLMNRCAHKGASLLSAREGHCEGGLLRCPYPRLTYRLDGSIRTIPIKSGLRRDRARRDPARRAGIVPVRNVATHPRFVFARLAETAPGFTSYFGDALSSIDNMVDRSPLGRLEVAGRARCAICTTATGRCSSRT